jgi:hypothetical protein
MNIRSLTFLAARLAMASVYLFDWQPAQGFFDDVRAGTLETLCDRAESITLMKAKDRVPPGPARPTVETPLPTPGMGWASYYYFVARHDDRLLDTGNQSH